MAYSTRAMLPADWQLLRHFQPEEFKAPEKMGYQFMLALDKLAEQAGVPCRVTSSFRSKAYNKSVGGAKDSAHTDEPLCEAVDLSPRNNADRFEIMAAAILNGWDRIGLYKNGSLHFDKTSGRRPARRLWCVVDNPA